ncbi:MAG: hypothetical protein M3Y34_06180 [Actinomycetota bacterium]|nr:hypothetical protein [Actinomycetota bacterium]
MPKYREIIFPMTEDVQILYMRSSARPVEYVVMLQMRDGDGWKTVLSVDNSHEAERRDTSVDDHHCHRYIGDKKRSPEPLPFAVVDTNDAMAKAIQWFADDWEALIS